MILAVVVLTPYHLRKHHTILPMRILSLTKKESGAGSVAISCSWSWSIEEYSNEHVLLLMRRAIVVVCSVLN